MVLEHVDVKFFFRYQKFHAKCSKLLSYSNYIISNTLSRLSASPATAFDVVPNGIGWEICK